MIGTATVDGQPYALDAQALDVRPRRAEPGRAQGHDRRQGRAPRTASGTRPTSSASRSTGPTPRATRRRTSPPACCRGAPAVSTGGCRPSAPVITSGRASSASNEHPHDVGGPNGLLLNWNNQSAPGFMHGDDEPYGSVHRVELFDKCPRAGQLADNASIMNRAATEDVRSPVWPVVSQVLHGGPAPSARDAQVVDVLDDWVSRDAPRLDADVDGLYDERRPGDHGRRLATDRRRGDATGVRQTCSATSTTSAASAASPASPTSTRTSGRCSATRSGAVSTSPTAAMARCRPVVIRCGRRCTSRPRPWPRSWGRTRRSGWKAASTTGFVPGLLPNRFPTTNRPTFQQVLEFQRNWHGHGHGDRHGDGHWHGDGQGR